MISCLKNSPFARLRNYIIRACVLAVTGLILIALFPRNCAAGEPNQDAGTNKFPSAAEVLGSQTFDNSTEQNIYFLQAIHDRYHSHWSDLLDANISLQEYILSPEKLERFIDELGDAMRDRNDSVSCSNLVLITGDPAFYADTNNYHVEILQAAARALIKIGPAGRIALASCFSETHYRTDPGSLEDLADVIGEERPADPAFNEALAATAFKFATTNGSIYPRCTTTAVKNLLSLSGGPSAVQAHLKTEEVLDNPGRFQAVMDGIAAGHASQLSTNLVEIQAKVQARLAGLTNSPGVYRDDLQELEARIERTLANFQNSGTRKMGS